MLLEVGCKWSNREHIEAPVSAVRESQIELNEIIPSCYRWSASKANKNTNETNVVI